jgi:hypothetical protein
VSRDFHTKKIERCKEIDRDKLIVHRKKRQSSEAFIKAAQSENKKSENKKGKKKRSFGQDRKGPEMFGVIRESMKVIAKEAAKLAALIRARKPTYQMRPELYNYCDTDGGKRNLHAELNKCSKRMNCGPVPKWRADPAPPAPAPVVSFVREATKPEQEDKRLWLNHHLSNCKIGKPNNNVNQVWHGEYEFALCFIGAVQNNLHRVINLQLTSVFVLSGCDQCPSAADASLNRKFVNAKASGALETSFVKYVKNREPKLVDEVTDVEVHLVHVSDRAGMLRNDERTTD